MVPRYLSQQQSLPRTVTGKLQRLSTPTMRVSGRGQLKDRQLNGQLRLLSRQPHLSPDRIQALQQMATMQGFVIARLRLSQTT